ncbi:beta-N-acetylglucosaminidase domain-containing protein [Clostridium sardiniense]|uniref:beta-N-acetylglucosaminidase domain-containing protein n=1 Tax=Clostridium sardiniense TaxID=29369 RepID=UPI003D344925
MLRNKKKKALKIGVATTCFLSLGITTFATPLAYGMTATKEKVDIVNNKLDIYPLPQKTEYTSQDGFKIKGKINIVVHGEQEKATLPRLKNSLDKHKIPYEVGENVDNNKANIILSSDKEHCNDCTEGMTDNLGTLKKEEGYILSASDDVNKNGLIKITGTDKDGVYYGVLTLDQILDQSTGSNKIAEVVISDSPEIKHRGFIEGFYGTPWSHEDRKSLMKDTSEYKMNTYIYAPKDDIYHRAEWKELYPADKAKEIAELAKAGTDNNLNFCWTIHPGATLQFTDEDYNAIINKFEQLYSLGVRQFGVLFDDTDDWSRGKLQAEWINRINKEFVKAKGDVAPMIVISARYNSAWGPNIDRYFKPFMETLDKDIEVMWTGHATMSNVSKEVFEWPKTATGVDKDVSVWWNYPVNDYCDSKLLMAPMPNLNPDLDNVTGFFSNPMNQAEASKVALYSIADYTWNTNEFKYQKSWERAIEELVPEASEEFKRFASNISYLSDDGGASGPFIFDESVYLKEKIDSFKNAIQKGESIKKAATVLLNEFNTLKSDAKTLKSKLKNKNLLKEITPFLGAYESLSEAGIASMKAIIAAEEGAIKEWITNTKIANQKLNAMNDFTVDRIEAEGPKTYVVDVGTKLLKPLVSETITKGESIMSEKLNGDKSPKVIGNVKDMPKVDVKTTSGKYSINDISNINMNNNDYIGFAMPKAVMLDKIELKADNYDDIELQYSLNGIEWTKAETEMVDGVLTSNTDVPATFVRVVNISSGSISPKINKLETTPIYKTKLAISENIGIYGDNKIENAIDGDMETKYWSNKPSAEGHYIKVDLGSVIPLYDVKSYFAVSDRMRNSEYEISVDGDNWTSLGELKYVEENGKMVAAVNAEGQMARYIRIKANGSNTEGNSSYWVQLYEIEINKTVPSESDDYVELVTGNPKGNFENLYDGDLSTAYAPESVKSGDNIVYKMSRVTDVQELMFLQDEKNISDAKVSIKGLDGKWLDVGKLDEEFKTFDIKKTILEVKLEFDSSKPAPKIYEIITKEGAVESPKEVDKSKLKDLISSAKKLDLSKYTSKTAKLVKDSLKEAEKVLNNEDVTQEQIDKAVKGLQESIDKLVLKNDKDNASDPDKGEGSNNNTKPDDTNNNGNNSGSDGANNNKPIPDTGRENLGFMAGAVGLILAGLGILKKRG